MGMGCSDERTAFMVLFRSRIKADEIVVTFLLRKPATKKQY
jgi:hypothetical protein